MKSLSHNNFAALKQWSGGTMPKQYLVVHFKSKKDRQILEAIDAHEVTIGGAKVWRPEKPEPPFKEIKALKIENEGMPASYLPLDEIEDWALLTTKTQSNEK
jgi:hypothetical protein